MAESERDKSGQLLKERLEVAMVSRLADTDAHFKHQQRGEPDIQREEKANIALDILHKSPAIFLERFSRYLTLDDVGYFEDMKGDYLIDFYMKEITKRCKDTNHNAVKNRRYQALQELMAGGEYFSNDEMKWRDPLLFEQMVGQYETRTEQDERDIDKTDLRFSTILLKHMDVQASKQFYDKLKEREEEQEEEDESDEDEEVVDSNKKINYPCTMETQEEKYGDDDLHVEEEMTLPEAERNQLRMEFLRIMQERFLSGEDVDFNYSTVDSNTDYDSLDILGQDAEEKYFDAEDDDNSSQERHVTAARGKEGAEHTDITQGVHSLRVAAEEEELWDRQEGDGEGVKADRMDVEDDKSLTAMGDLVGQGAIGI